MRIYDRCGFMIYDVKDRIENVLKKENIKAEVLVNENLKIDALITIPCFKCEIKGTKDVSERALKVGNILRDKGFEVEVKGPYVNVVFGKKDVEMFLRNKIKVRRVKDNYKRLFDYVGPNIGKPFHVGHFRNAIFGSSLINIYRYKGYNVITDNHIGDWGTQFGKLIYAFKKWGNRDELKERGTEYLLKLYIKFHEEAEKNKEMKEGAKKELVKLMEGDKENRVLWEEFVKINRKYFDEIFNMLKIEFDYELGESFFVDKGKRLVKEMLNKGVAKKDDGAVIVPLEKYGMGNLIVLKKDGSTLYATHDLAALEYRKKKIKVDKVYYIVGKEQEYYFKQIFKIAEILGLYKEEDLKFIGYGMVNLPEGKMSTRKGNIILIDDVINKAKELAKKLLVDKNSDIDDLDKGSEILGMGVIRFTMLSQARNKDVVFDWKKIMSFEGDTAPYVMYTYARCESLVNKSKVKEGSFEKMGNIEKDLINYMAKFEYYVDKAISKNDPHVLVSYVLELTHKYNNYYQKERIINTDKEYLGVVITKKVAETIKEVMDLLNIDLMEKM